MSRPLTDILLDFIAELRHACVPISVAESLDAMRAITLAGLARLRLREALRASLIKDEAHRDTFERAFSAFFAPPRKVSGDPRQSRGAHIGLHGAHSRSGSEISAPSLRYAADSQSSKSGSTLGLIRAASAFRRPQSKKRQLNLHRTNRSINDPVSWLQTIRTKPLPLSAGTIRLVQGKSPAHLWRPSNIFRS